MGRGRPGTGVWPREHSITIRFTTADGKRYAEKLNLEPTPANIRVAERKVATIKKEIGRGDFDYAAHFPGSGKARLASTSFADYADVWLETFIGEESTRQLYTKLLNGTWKPAFEGKALADIRYSDIKRVRAARSKTVTAKSINNDMTVLRAIYEMAIRDKVLTENPTAEFTSLDHQAEPPNPLTLEQMERVVGHMKVKYHLAAWAYFEFAFQTGLRPSEEIILRWSRIDWAAGTAKIDTARTVNTEKRTKTKSVRFVDLTPRALAALEAMKPYTFLKGVDAPVFFNPNTGRPWTSDRSQREHFFHPTLKALKLPGRDAYQTRHTYATTALMGGVNPSYIARQLGHANTRMLFQIYGRWIDGADRGRELAKLATIYAPSEFGTHLAQTPHRNRKILDL